MIYPSALHLLLVISLWTFCCSRPNDKITCFNKKCPIFPKLTDGSDCTATGVVYKIICKYCNQAYIGEFSRSLHERLMEHNRYASSPTNYHEEALSTHYTKYHINCKPDLSFSILERVKSTVMRKIKEAFHIVNQKPEINLKQECISLERYLNKSTRAASFLYNRGILPYFSLYI